MPIDKVGFSGLEHTLPLSSQSKRDKSEKASTTPSDNEISNASKYMIGAAALAGVVALGIIGHKNNWWRKASQAAEDLKPKISQESPEIPHTPNTPRKVDTQVDYSNISTIKGKRINLKDKSVIITQTDKSGNVVSEFYSRDGRTVCEVNEYDPTTKKHIRTIGVRKDGTREYIINRAQESNHAVMTYFRKDGKTPESIRTLDSKGKPVKITYLREDGKTPKLIANFDSKGEPVEITFFGENGETPAARVYRDTNTENDCSRVEMLNPDGSSKCVFDITSDSNKFDIISGTITEKDVPYIEKIFDEIDKLL